MALLTTESIKRITDELIRGRAQDPQPLPTLNPHWQPGVIPTSQVDAEKAAYDEKIAALKGQVEDLAGTAPKLGSLTAEFIKATDSDEERENVSRSMDILFERIEEDETK